jgi:hypothetical protein
MIRIYLPLIPRAFFALIFFTSLQLSAQICTGCDDPIDPSNCGAPTCEIDCPECDTPPEPEVPVDQGILQLLAGGMSIIGYTVYRKLSLS